MPVKRSSVLLLAAINVAVGLVMSAGGFLEAAGSVRRGSDATVVLGALGGVAGILFLASAFGLWTRRHSARRITRTAAALALAVHGAGVVIAHPGILAILLGVVYPAVVLLLMGTRPGLGSGEATGGDPRKDDAMPRPRDGALRVATA